MESINANQTSAMVQKNLLESLNDVQKQNNKVTGSAIDMTDGGAYMVGANLLGGISGFDSFFDKFAMFKDGISTAQNTYDKMREQGEELLALINRAHSDEEGNEDLKAIDAQAKKLVDSINNLYNGMEFNGINLASEPMVMRVPSWQNIFGVPGVSQSDSEEKQISELLASISVDFDMSGILGNSAFGMSGSAEIKIGLTDDGALQITVDTSMSFDLSGINQYGVESDESFDMINNFLEMLGIQQDKLSNASSFMDALFEQAFGNLGGFGPGFSVENSGLTSGEIVQHASITLDGANQMPNIAINIL